MTLGIKGTITPNPVGLVGGFVLEVGTRGLGAFVVRVHIVDMYVNSGSHASQLRRTLVVRGASDHYDGIAHFYFSVANCTVRPRTAHPFTKTKRLREEVESCGTIFVEEVWADRWILMTVVFGHWAPIRLDGDCERSKVNERREWCIGAELRSANDDGSESWRSFLPRLTFTLTLKTHLDKGHSA